MIDRWQFNRTKIKWWVNWWVVPPSGRNHFVFQRHLARHSLRQTSSSVRRTTKTSLHLRKLSLFRNCTRLRSPESSRHHTPSCSARQGGALGWTGLIGQGIGEFETAERKNPSRRCGSPASMVTRVTSLASVEPSRAKRSVLRTTLHGQHHDYGLGSAREVRLRWWVATWKPIDSPQRS